MTLGKTKRRVLAAAGVGAMLAAYPLADSFAAQEDQSPQANGADLVRQGEAYPAVDVDEAGGALAVTLRKNGIDDYGTVLATYRSPDGTWGEASELTIAGSGNDLAVVDTGPAGTGVVAWRHTGPEGRATVMTRTRDADGTWGPLEQLTGYADRLSTVDIRVSGDGAAVVSWHQDDGLHAAYRPAGGGWSTRLISPDAEDTQLAVDGAGTAYLAYWSPSVAGGAGALLLSTRTPDSGWVAPEILDGEHEITSFDFEVSESGLRRLAMNVAGDGIWMLRQRVAGGALVRDWTGMSGERIQLAVAGSRIRLLWTHQSGPDVHLALFTRDFGDSAWTPAVRLREPVGLEVRDLVCAMDIRSDGTGLITYYEVDDRADSVGPVHMRRTGADGTVSGEQVLDGHNYIDGEGSPAVSVGEHGFGAIGWVEQPGSDSVRTRVRGFTP